MMVVSCRHADIGQHEVGHVLQNRGETRPAVMSDTDFEATLYELFGNQRRGLTVVFDAQDPFARFRHALGPIRRRNRILG